MEYPYNVGAMQRHALRESRSIDYYRDRVLEQWPRLVDYPDAIDKCATLLLTCDYQIDRDGQVVDRSDSSGYVDDTHAVIADVLTWHLFADAPDMTIGEVNPLRAMHAWVNDHQYEESRVAPAPDWYTSQASDIQRKRSNSGKTVTTVLKHGRGWSTGSGRLHSVYGPHLRDLTNYDGIDRETRDVRFAALLSDVRRSANGSYDGIDLARLTSAIYDVPALIGGESESWSEVIPEEVSAQVRDGAYVMGDGTEGTGGNYNYAAHSTATVDKKRDRDPVAWPTRTRLPMPRVRDAERTDHMSIELLGAHTDTDYAWRGHHKYLRPPTVKRSRETTRVTTAVVIPDNQLLPDALAAAALGMERGDRVAWREPRTGDTGTLTFSKGGQYTCRISGGAWRVYGLRTVKGLRNAIANH